MDNFTTNDMNENSLLQILSENYEAVYYVDFDLDIIKPYRLNKVIGEKFGKYFNSNPSYKEAMTKYIEAIVINEDKEEMLKRANPDFICNKMKDRQAYSYDFRVKRDNKLLYYRFKISNLNGIGELHKAVVGFANVTSEMDRVNEIVESQAMLNLLKYDKLTGLLSKEFFLKEVKEYIDNHPDEDLMMWTSDVQGLKVINEKYGMEKGDEVLSAMAMGAQYFPGFILGGRMEGDKFSALMINNNPDLEEVNAILTANSRMDFPVPNVIIKHGIYNINKGSTLSVHGMYDRSVLALNSIKSKYGINVARYDDKLRKDLLINRQIMENASKSLTDNQFKVYYQPKISTTNEHLNGAEALVRWIHPELGFINPGVFIPLFEQNGFITNLDFYIWEEVCKDLKEWNQKGISDIVVSVNVSRRDFDIPDLADKIIALADKYNIKHSSLQIEITESSYSDNPEHIQNTINQLHNSGFSIALDDFGTGYSSMLALSSLDLDYIKLDMSIVQNDVPGSDKNILEFSVQLAKMLHLKTVAEGVETINQVNRIKSLDVDLIQGYYYSKPLCKEDFEAFIQNHPPK